MTFFRAGTARSNALGGLFSKLSPGRLRPIATLWPYVMRYPWRILLALVFLVVSTLSSLMVPAVLGRLIDMGFAAQHMGSISVYVALIAVFGFVSALANGARLYCISYVGERVMTDIRTAVFAHLLSLDTRFFDASRIGELTSRLVADVATIRGAIGATASIALRSCLTILGAFVLMLFTSPTLTLAVVAAGPLILFPMLFFARRLRKMSRRSQDAVAELSALSTEILGANRTIKSFTRETEEVERYRQRGEESFFSELSRIKIRSMLVALLMTLSSLGLIIIIWWGARAVFEGIATTGQLTQFLLYAMMGGGALASLSDVMGTVQTLAGSTERLGEILATKPIVLPPAQPIALPEPARGHVQFSGVSFDYGQAGNAPVLDDVSFETGNGKMTALVGASGAGKSTIFALLQRFYDVTGGAIAVDGVDIRQADPAKLRRRIAVVDQDPTIFSGTIEDNIRIGNPAATTDEIIAAAQASLVDEFVQQLPAKYATLVGERGITLSGGQRQRLAIARAVLKDAPILLLDEATSALDAQSEHLVQTALARLRAGRTTLVIAHRLATIRDADMILVLDRGRIIDRGTHGELIARGGKYADLARLQFRADEG